MGWPPCPPWEVWRATPSLPSPDLQSWPRPRASSRLWRAPGGHRQCSGDQDWGDPSCSTTSLHLGQDHSRPSPAWRGLSSLRPSTNWTNSAWREITAMWRPGRQVSVESLRPSGRREYWGGPRRDWASSPGSATSVSRTRTRTRCAGPRSSPPGTFSLPATVLITAV